MSGQATPTVKLIGLPVYLANRTVALMAADQRMESRLSGLPGGQKELASSPFHPPKAQVEGCRLPKLAPMEEFMHTSESPTKRSLSAAYSRPIPVKLSKLDSEDDSSLDSNDSPSSGEILARKS